MATKNGTRNTLGAAVAQVIAAKIRGKDVRNRIADMEAIINNGSFAQAVDLSRAFGLVENIDDKTPKDIATKRQTDYEKALNTLHSRVMAKRAVDPISEALGETAGARRDTVDDED